MKTAISIPDEVFDAADKEAARLGISRSQFYVTAIRKFLAEQRSTSVTETLDRLYGSVDFEPDPAFLRMGLATLAEDEW